MQVSPCPSLVPHMGPPARPLYHLIPTWPGGDKPNLDGDVSSLLSQTGLLRLSGSDFLFQIWRFCWKINGEPHQSNTHMGVNGKRGREPKMLTPFVQTAPAAACPWLRAAPQVHSELGGPGSQAAPEPNGRACPSPWCSRQAWCPTEEASVGYKDGTPFREGAALFQSLDTPGLQCILRGQAGSRRRVTRLWLCVTAGPCWPLRHRNLFHSRLFNLFPTLDF